jgi:hypothetical protein
LDVFRAFRQAQRAMQFTELVEVCAGVLIQISHCTEKRQQT